METTLNLIMKHEGLRLKAYRCPAGVWTIGYGHTGNDVYPGQSITVEEARELLRRDVIALRSQLDDLCQLTGVELSGNRIAALLSFAYNVGFRALRRSTLWLKVVINQDEPSIADEFARWKYAGGKMMSGLVKRRAEEAALYFAQ
ncbi:MAG: lysozyme [Bacteroides sp.]|nr:lysozyme [Bacteroides sp.]MCM1378473.1 lysozyme [Bacteroides sp.]MCM1444774.1 lysozyme [Prevotella sp.]